ncbi:diacylglycerol/lipid kinase family protein [Demequina muriae]|uniref:Diacylglycerol kinase family protein n=1 Tax=Demequina muriae TaxID=3051664 RepID=A0ABT8GG65_9MICO|nr:diacylglycerol kinase family protein [Demequina sp. EGI L300058]MDN4480415.1 diacylglycerol kinase family protein [Demequina sp. EGI L300058]
MLGTILGSVALGISLVALVMAITLVRSLGARDPLAVPRMWRRVLMVRSTIPGNSGRFTADSPDKPSIAFIANPTKEGVQEMHERALRACSIRYLPQPMWFHTTEEDPGYGMARDAIAAGADVVVAVGGDGTVRAVAEACAGTGATMGILPLGTGNLFARNLDFPVGDTPALLRAVLDGDDLTVDVGYLDIERAFSGHGEDGRYLFLVMAGAGMDAEMVASTNPTLKRRLGWLAYFFAALRHLHDKRMTASVSIDGAEPVQNEMRTVLVANAGRLPGGLQLIPDASITDGQLDIATLDARAGIVGWTDLFGSVIAQGAGIKQSELLRAWRVSRIDHARGEKVEIEMDAPYRVQVDGESLGRAKRVTAFVEHGALTVRVPIDEARGARDAKEAQEAKEATAAIEAGADVG